MTAPPSLEERVSTVEDTVQELGTSLPLAAGYLKTMLKDMGVVKHDGAVARQGILDLSVEASEIQGTLGRYGKTLDRHSRDLTDIKATLGDHGRDLTDVKTTLGDHSRDLTDVRATLGDHGTMLKELAATLNVVLSKLDER
jgi:hypothetical protein